MYFSNRKSFRLPLLIFTLVSKPTVTNYKLTTTCYQQGDNRITIKSKHTNIKSKIGNEIKSSNQKFCANQSIGKHNFRDKVALMLHNIERNIQSYNDDGLSPMIITVKIRRNFCTIIAIIC